MIWGELGSEFSDMLLNVEKVNQQVPLLTARILGRRVLALLFTSAHNNAKASSLATLAIALDYLA